MKVLISPNSNFGVRTSMQCYGEAWKVRGVADEDLRDFGPSSWEWRRLLKGRCSIGDFEMLCCPEDIMCEQTHDRKIHLPSL